MSQTKTTLAAALGANALELLATAATGATVGGFAKVEDEYSIITTITGSVIGVRSRGSFGTVAKAHATGAALVFGTLADIPEPNSQLSNSSAPVRDVINYSAAGAITLPNGRDMVAVVGCGAGAGQAMTLANPAKTASGLMIHIVSASAYAHTVTLTTGYGGSNATDVLTFSGAAGDSVTLMSLHGTWSHIATGLVAADTVSVTVD